MTAERARPTFLLLFCALSLAPAARAVDVALCTDRGPVTITLDEQRAPLHTANFLRYVDAGLYSGTVFHRVLDGQIVQAGGYDRQLRPIEPFDPVPNESDNGLGNIRGTLAAARTDDPDSATSQFYVNLKGNTHLDASRGRAGFTVFGEVSSGLERLDAISGLPTGPRAPLPSDVPAPLVGIKSAARIDHRVLDALDPETRAATLRARVLDAAAGGSPAAVLEAMSHFRSTCAEPDPELLLAAAEAAVALDQAPRARRILDAWFAAAEADDPGRARARELEAGVRPGSQQDVARIAPACDSPGAPELADGATADMEAMIASQEAVREFIATSETYLDCLSVLIEDNELGETDHAAAVRAHNRQVGIMESVAEAFNEQVRAFRARD